MTMLDKLLDKLVNVASEGAVFEEKTIRQAKEMVSLEDEIVDLSKRVEYYQDLLEKEERKVDASEKRFRDLYRNTIDRQKNEEQDVAKKIIISFLVILLKQDIIKPSKKVVFSFIRIYRHLTGEGLTKSRKEINEVLHSIDDYDIITSTIEDKDFFSESSGVSEIPDVRDNVFSAAEIETDPSLLPIAEQINKADGEKKVSNAHSKPYHLLGNHHSETPNFPSGSIGNGDKTLPAIPMPTSLARVHGDIFSELQKDVTGDIKEVSTHTKCRVASEPTDETPGNS